MQVLDNAEIDTVSGGFSPYQGATLTIGLMAMMPASVVIMSVGALCLGGYAIAQYMTQN